MKKIVLLAVTVMLAATITSCGNRKAKSNTAEPVATEVAGALDLDLLLEGAEQYINKEVEVEAICTHLCQHGATKMFLLGSDDTKTIRVEAAKLGSFSQKCANSIVKVKGIVREERIDEAFLQEWEKMGADNHGDGESGCDTEKAARGETGNTTAQRIADFRARIAARNQAEGKAYLSFYYIEALSYEVVEG